MVQIPSSHPLSQLFRHLVGRRFCRDAGVRDAEACSYVSEVLIRFTHIENLYRIRNARGRRLEDVAEMLLESNPLLDGRSFDREREVRRHIGDYTLFFAGIFPERLEHLPRLKRLSLDVFVDYIRAGKESYGIVSAFNLFEYRREASLFRRLADGFEQCVYGLNLVKRDLETLQRTHYCLWQEALD
ncbi:MAG: hypothetical protein OXI69_14175 [Acidobacteriota bacterium]|nr:hypothetical protein [Acidobacteriota bacterium]